MPSDIVHIDAERLDVEREVSVQHVVVVDLDNLREIAVLCEAKLVAVHFLPGFRMGHLRCDL